MESPARSSRENDERPAEDLRQTATTARRPHRFGRQSVVASVAMLATLAVLLHEAFALAAFATSVATMRTFRVPWQWALGAGLIALSLAAIVLVFGLSSISDYLATGSYVLIALGVGAGLIEAIGSAESRRRFP